LSCGALDRGCLQACDAAFPQGEAAFKPIGHAFGVCYAACPKGQDFFCLGSVDWPVAQKAGPIQLRQSAYDYLSKAPLAQAKVRACGAVSSPCAEVSGAVTADTNGVAALMVSVAPGGNGTFQGYLRWEDATHLPLLYYTGVYPARDETLQDAYTMTAETLAALSSLTGKGDFDLSAGVVIAIMRDCLTYTSGDVKLRLSPDSGFTFYPVDKMSEWSSATSTDYLGLAVAYNVAPGLSKVEAVTNLAGAESTYASRLVVVEAGTITMVELVPQ
jgi:hypothetical protein